MRHLLRSLLNRGSSVFAAIVGLAVLVPASLAQSTVPLRYKWEEGQVLRYRMTSETTSESSGPSAPAKTSGKDVTVVRMTVQSVAADGTATIASVLESSESVAEETSDSTTKWPESVKAREASQAMIEEVLNERFILVIRSDGSVKQATGFERIRDITNRSLTDMPPEMKRTFDDYFSDDAAKDMLGLYVVTFPSNEVKFGESWTHRAVMALPLVGALSNRMTMTYKGMVEATGSQLAKVDIATRISHEPARRGHFADLMDDASVTIQDGTGSGEIWFDSQRGQLIKQITRDAMSISITLGKDMKITQRVQAVRTLELMEDSTAPGAAVVEKK